MKSQDNDASQKALKFLNHHHTGILSTVSKDGEPWGSAVNFIVDDKLNFYFMTRAKTLKYKNIEEQPLVAMTVVDEESQTTVQAVGVITKLPTKDTMDIINKLAHIKPRSDYGWIPPVIKVHQGDYMILVITPSKLQYADYGHSMSDVHDEYIEQVL